MGIDLSGLNIRVAEQFLKDSDIDPVLQHVGGETVAQGMASGLLDNAGLLCGAFYRFLQARFKDMMAHLSAGSRVA